MKTVEEFNSTIDGAELNGRVGLEEGSFYLGHTGGGGRMGFSILGDCANTAARLEGMNKDMGTHILASQAVVQDDDTLLLRSLGKFKLKGQPTPVPVVQVVGFRGHSDAPMERLCSEFSEALSVYYSQDWAAAAEAFKKVLQDFPDDGPSKFFLERSEKNVRRSAHYDNPDIVHIYNK